MKPVDDDQAPAPHDPGPSTTPEAAGTAPDAGAPDPGLEDAAAEPSGANAEGEPPEDTDDTTADDGPPEVDRFQDLVSFQGAIAASIVAKADQVRHIIGGVHWPSDGTYKERLVKEAVAAVLPSTLQVGDGFTVYPEPKTDPVKLHASRQMDILVYDSRVLAPVFRDGDFVVVLASATPAMMEVKATWDKGHEQLRDAFDKSVTAFVLRAHAKHDQDVHLFTALVGFGHEGETKDGRATPRGVRSIGRALAKAYTKAFGMPEDFEQLFSRNRAGLYPLIPSVVVSLHQCSWIGVVQYARSSGAGHVAYVPVIRFFDPWVTNSEDRLSNHALHVLLALLSEHLATVAKSKGYGPEDYLLKLSTPLRWSTSYEQIGPPIALLSLPEEIRERFPEVRFFDYSEDEAGEGEGDTGDETDEQHDGPAASVDAASGTTSHSPDAGTE